VFEEALLDGVESRDQGTRNRDQGFWGEAFDGGDGCALGLEHGDEAGVDEVGLSVSAVHEDGAGAAFAFAAAFFCAGEAEVLAEDVEEAFHRRGVDRDPLSVDC
jgi:hypothetical protein